MKDCMPDDRSQLRRDLILVFAIGLFLRLTLLFFFPAPFGNDAAGRLYFRDSLLAWHWLPVTQALVHFTYVLTHSVVIVRLVFAIAGSLAAVAFAFYLQAFAPRRAALIGGLLFAINAQAVYLSLMPYQEIVFLGMLFGSLAFFARAPEMQKPNRNFIIGSILYGLACLTRYEAWFILPILFAARIWRAVKTRKAAVILRQSVKSFIGLGWGAALWLLVNWQFWDSPTAFLFHRPDQAFYAWNPHGEIMRIMNYLGNMLYWLMRFGSPVILFAIPGIGVVWKNRQKVFPVLWPLFVLFLFVLTFLIFIAGQEFATANRFVMIPLSVVLIFAALGLDDFIARPSNFSRRLPQKLLQPIPKVMAAVFLFLALLFYGAVPVVNANRLADYREPYEVAKFLETHLANRESAVIIARSFDGEVPMPYQRVFGQLNFDKEHLFSSFLLESQNLIASESFVRRRNLRFIVVFGNDQLRTDNDAFFLQLVQNSQNNIKQVFANNAAAIYERTSSWSKN